MLEIKEKLENKKDEVEENIKGFERCRDKLLHSGIAVEYDIPISERKEFRDLILEFLNKKISDEETEIDEIQTSISYYEY